jgi:hypothetical protein
VKHGEASWCWGTVVPYAGGGSRRTSLESTLLGVWATRAIFAREQLKSCWSWPIFSGGTETRSASVKLNPSQQPPTQIYRVGKQALVCEFAAQHVRQYRSNQLLSLQSTQENTKIPIMQTVPEK